MTIPLAAGPLLARVNGLLKSRYGTPRLGNKHHPVSELVFIILSARTRGREHEGAYRNLRRTFRSWENVRDAPVQAVERAIRDAGLGRIKARQIKGLLTSLARDFGSLSGSGLRRLNDVQLERYLTTLPGVGLKTARCMMLYSLDRDTFPVDTHCMRLFENLGLIQDRMRFEVAQEPLQAMVPRGMRGSLHINAVAHGRETCIPGTPHCSTCVIRALCLRARL
jgi:endonuclease-3